MSKHTLVIRQVTSEESAALRAFAHCMGRRWKHELLMTYWCNARVWLDADYSPDKGTVLHGLRNDPRFGVEGLQRFKLTSGEG